MDPVQIASNFSDLKPPLSFEHAVAEAARCLYCYDAPCTQACPTSINVPEFIRRIASGNLRGAAHTILESNILGSSCARVCPTEVLCEGSCVLLQLNMPPVDIGRLQRYATDHALEQRIQPFSPAEKTARSVALIGAGPASLACAAQLSLLGYRAVVFEARPEAGGLNRYGIAPYKLTDEDARREVSYIQEITGFELRTGTPVDDPRKLESEYDAIFLGVGLGGSRRLMVPGEDKEGVIGATEFIEGLRSKPLHETRVGEHVVVLGAGNTAIDAATEAARLGARQVAIVYRRGKDEMPCYEFEYELALKDRVVFRWHTQPVEVLGDGRVTALRCQATRPGEPDASGRPRPVPVPGSEFTIPADMVIKATGQESLKDLLGKIPGLKLAGGQILVNDDCQTGNPRYFAGGDCVSGGKEVVNAVADGRQAALAIHRMLSAGKGEA
ncbi:MAG: NAD(P)-dependent oxidoreductase [Armatimonadetes bacterium]|nr:NAD(P)-dependent oxidoreductase [Armatimonadota bacterium]